MGKGTNDKMKMVQRKTQKAFSKESKQPWLGNSEAEYLNNIRDFLQN